MLLVYNYVSITFKGITLVILNSLRWWPRNFARGKYDKTLDLQVWKRRKILPASTLAKACFWEFLFHLMTYIFLNLTLLQRICAPSNKALWHPLSTAMFLALEPPSSGLGRASPLTTEQGPIGTTTAEEIFCQLIGQSGHCWLSWLGPLYYPGAWEVQENP